MAAIEGVFFDLDGTLLDTAEDFIVAINRMLRNHAKAPIADDLIRKNLSAGSKTLTQIAFNLPQGKELEQKRDEFLQYYDHHLKDDRRASLSTLYPGIAELISELEQRKLPWGIVTNKPRSYSLQLLQQLNILDRSHILVCPDDVKYAKPHPEALFLACKQTRCNPENSVYIGDHIRDIEAGKKAGMFTVAAHYGYIADGDDPFRWQADLNIDKASELHDWLITNDWKVPE